MSNTYGEQKKGWMWVSLVLFVLLVGVTIFAFTKGGTEQTADGTEQTTAPDATSESDSVVAVVNGVEIMKNALYDEMVRSGGSQLLESLISQELVRQEYEKAGFATTDADLDNEVKLLKDSFPSEQDFLMMLMQYGMTEDELRQEMGIQVQLRKLLEPKTDVTDEEIQQYYDANKDSMSTPEEVRASHILVATQEEADTVLAELKGGADFAAVAAAKSTDPGSKDLGGDLDFFGRGVMVPEFEEAAFTLPIGELSEPVQTTHGFHIIKVTEKKEAVTPTLEEKKEMIRQTLVSEEIRTLSNEWIQEVRGQAQIENKLL